MTRTVNDVLKEGVQSLKETSETPQLDAEILLCEVLNISRADLFFKKQETIDDREHKQYQELVERRAVGEPVAYILQKKDFYKDSFYVDSRVLVPRPETEILVEEAVEFLKINKKTKVLDICCGSGCVGLSIKRDTNCDLTLSDISKDALEVTKINAEKLFSDKEISIVQSDLFGNISDKFDVITANPPYLSEKDMNVYCKNGLEYEPEEALLSGKTGFEITKKIIDQASEYLNENGSLILELGFEGAQFLKNIQDLKLEKVVKDLAGIERVAVFTLHK